MNKFTGIFGLNIFTPQSVHAASPPPSADFLFLDLSDFLFLDGTDFTFLGP